MRNDLAQEKQKEAQDAALWLSPSRHRTLRSKASSWGTEQMDRPIHGAVPPQQPEAATTPTACGSGSRRNKLQCSLEADEKKRIDNARFASNLVFTRSQEQLPASQAQQSERWSSRELLLHATTPAATAAPTARPSRDQIPATAYKRPAEVNLNTLLIGQPYVIYEGLTLDTILMNRLDGDAVGPVKVLVSNPVYSHDHQHVLIPEGTVVLGEARKIGASGTRPTTADRRCLPPAHHAGRL